MKTPKIVCTECHAEAEALDWRCTRCGGPLDLADYPRFDSDVIHRSDWSLWRYSVMLPVEQCVSLGEGGTPLVSTEINGVRFLAKLEYLNPTGSYKDRGTVTMMSHMASHDVSAVVEDSSGNAGASVAAYSSALGIRARIFVPASASEGKKALIRAFGGELVEVEGGQHQKTLACMEAAETTPYASHAWSPYFVLGQMTVAWEVWEQMGRRAPAAIVCPVGHGGLFLGFARGFRLLYEARMIDRMPRMIAVQSEGCDPIVQAWERGDEKPLHVTPTPTVADGIIVEVPVRGKEVLRAIRETGGMAIRVNNEQILDAQRKLHARGVLCEPTSSVPAAALNVVRQRIGNEADMVVPLTGNALKMLPVK